jgi:hypothetical protein
VAVAYELPDDEPVTAYKLTDLPAGWRRYPVPTAVQGIGGDWLDAGAAAALIVPSAVLPIAGEHNFVLNPAHPGVEALVDVGQDPLLVGADRKGDANEGLELGAARPGQPAFERRARPLGLAVIERIGEGVAQQSRAERARVVALDINELVLIAAREIPGAFEQRIRAPLLSC